MKTSDKWSLNQRLHRGFTINKKDLSTEEWIWGMPGYCLKIWSQVWQCFLIDGMGYHIFGQTRILPPAPWFLVGQEFGNPCFFKRSGFNQPHQSDRQ